MNWQSIESAPKDGTLILVRYIKRSETWITFPNGGRLYVRKVKYIPVITEAYYIPKYRHHKLGEEPHQYVYGGQWKDSVDRLITTDGAKNPTNVLTHWCERPTGLDSVEEASLIERVPHEEDYNYYAVVSDES